MLLLLVLVGVAGATTCYKSITTSNPYNVITKAKVDTQRGCEVRCDADTTCAGFYFVEAGSPNNCVLLESSTIKYHTCAALTTTFVKLTEGCVARTNLLAGFGTDPCIDSMTPIVSAFNSTPICPIDKNNLYIIRAIHADGTRFSYDNQRGNYLEQANLMWNLRFENLAPVPIVAAVCAIAGNKKCPCAKNGIGAPPNYLPKQDTAYPCLDRDKEFITTNFAKNLAKDYEKFTPADTISALVHCKGGLWIVWKESEQTSFGFGALSCHPKQN